MSDSSHHIVPLRVYFGIIAVLFVLTGVTVWVAFQDFGALNNLIAVGIAVFKALLVVMYFMHLKYSARILWLYAGAGGIFFVIMIALMMTDYGSRSWQQQPAPWDTPPAVTAAPHS